MFNLRKYRKPKTSAADLDRGTFPSTELETWFDLIDHICASGPENGVTERLVELSVILASAGSTRLLTPEAARSLRDAIRRSIPRDIAVDRLLRPLIVESDESTIMAFSADLEDCTQLPGWAPRRSMWSSPTSDGSTSTWSVWRRHTRLGLPHMHSLQFDPGPDLSEETIYDDLASFDADVTSSGSLSGLLQSLDARQIRAVGFTWNIVFEVEIEILSGHRSSSAPPANLGVESVLWWRSPRSHASEVGLA